MSDYIHNLSSMSKEIEELKRELNLKVIRYEEIIEVIASLNSNIEKLQAENKKLRKALSLKDNVIHEAEALLEEGLSLYLRFIKSGTSSFATETNIFLSDREKERLAPKELEGENMKILK